VSDWVSRPGPLLNGDSSFLQVRRCFVVGMAGFEPTASSSRTTEHTFEMTATCMFASRSRPSGGGLHAAGRPRDGPWNSGVCVGFLVARRGSPHGPGPARGGSSSARSFPAFLRPALLCRAHGARSGGCPGGAPLIACASLLCSLVRCTRSAPNDLVRRRDGAILRRSRDAGLVADRRHQPPDSVRHHPGVIARANLVAVLVLAITGRPALTKRQPAVPGVEREQPIQATVRAGHAAAAEVFALVPPVQMLGWARPASTAVSAQKEPRAPGQRGVVIQDVRYASSVAASIQTRASRNRSQPRSESNHETRGVSVAAVPALVTPLCAHHFPVR
jgi:hypothetical protein